MAYRYDAMGNRTSSSASGTSTSYTANNLNQVTQTSVGGTNTNISYDANGSTMVGARFDLQRRAMVALRCFVFEASCPR